jgi:DNA repair protein RadA/Sms
MALVSGLRDIPISDTLIAFGEVGLSGELRSVPRVQARINEAARMGFTECILPKSCLKQVTDTPENIKLIGVRTLAEAISFIR